MSYYEVVHNPIFDKEKTRLAETRKQINTKKKHTSERW
jgi:hypothetical protein